MTANCPWYSRGWQDGYHAAFHDQSHRDVRQRHQYNAGYADGMRNRILEEREAA